MKKFITLALIISMLVSMTACGSKTVDDTDSSSKPDTENSISAVTTEASTYSTTETVEEETAEPETEAVSQEIEIGQNSSLHSPINVPVNTDVDLSVFTMNGHSAKIANMTKDDFIEAFEIYGSEQYNPNNNSDIQNFLHFPYPRDENVGVWTPGENSNWIDKGGTNYEDLSEKARDARFEISNKASADYMQGYVYESESSFTTDVIRTLDGSEPHVEEISLDNLRAFVRNIERVQVETGWENGDTTNIITSLLLTNSDYRKNEKLESTISICSDSVKITAETCMDDVINVLGEGITIKDEATYTAYNEKIMIWSDGSYNLLVIDDVIHDNKDDPTMETHDCAFIIYPVNRLDLFNFNN